MYSQLAHFYDWSGTLDFSEQIHKKISELLRAKGIQAGVLLDVACGTGSLALLFQQQGWQVIGLDLSPAMLAQAVQKPQASNPPILWMEGDMRTFQLESPVDVITCLYDSLNHLLSLADLEQTFHNFYQKLKPGGLLIFDLNTEATYQHFWQGTDTAEGPQYRLIATAQYNPSTQQAKAHLVAQEYTETGFQQLEETVLQQYFSSACVTERLQSVGFISIQTDSFNPIDPPASVEALKTFWVCFKL